MKKVYNKIFSVFASSMMLFSLTSNFSTTLINAEENDNDDQILETESTETKEQETKAEAIKEDEENAEESNENETEKNIDKTKTIDVSSLDGIDFSSKRLLVSMNTAPDQDEVLSSYNNVYLLQYESEYEAKAAYLEYSMIASFVDVDTPLTVADEVNVTGEMTENTNPISELNQELNNVPNASGMIAVIDTGTDGSTEDSYSVIGDDVSDENGHGTKIIEAIKEQNNDARIMSIKAFGSNGVASVSSVYAALELAIESNVSYINLSISGPATQDNEAIVSAIQEAVSKGITVIGAAGNNGNLADYYIPGNISEALVVGVCDSKGNRLSTSNYGNTVDFNVVAESTSIAAAKMTGYLSKNGELKADHKLIFETDYSSSEEEKKSDTGFKPFATAPGYEATEEQQKYLDSYKKTGIDKVDVLTSESFDFNVADLSVTELNYVTAYNGGGTITNGYWRLSNGAYAYCAQGLMASPEVGDTTSDPYVIDNANLRKALYYGFGGVDNQLAQYSSDSDWQKVMTDEMASLAYTSTCVSIEAVDGWHWNYNVASIWGYITSLPDPGDSYQVYGVTVNGAGYNWQGNWTTKQVLVYGVYNPKGNLTMTKSSADTTITSGNSCYDLNGTQYTVYSDSGCTKSVGTLTVKSDGSANTISLTAGTYYVKETKAGKGYALDSAAHKVTVSSGQTTTFKASDNPLSDPVLIVVEKNDASGTRLANAQFTVEYYSGYYDSVPKVKATRSWVLKTNSKGQAVLSKDLLVSGDDFYYTTGKDATFPLGTVVIYESKAPAGYTLDGTTKHVIQIGLDKTGKIVEYNAPTVTDYKVTVSKKDVSGDEVKGATMQVIDKNGKVVDSWTSDGTEHSVKNLTEGESYTIQEVVAAKGYVKATDITFTAGKKDQHFDVIDKMVGVLKVDEKNHSVIGAKLQVLDKNGEVKDEWTTNGEIHYVDNLEVGQTYTLKEVETSKGYITAEDKKFTVTEEAKNQSISMMDEMNATLKIHKKDESGKSLKGVVYSIEYKENKEDEYAAFGEFTTDENGEIYIDHLDFGFYKITEIQTAEGMNLLADPIEIELPYEDANNEKCYDAEYEITDSADLIMPSTGVNPIGNVFLIGCGLVIGALIFFAMEESKKMNRKINGE